MCEKGAAKAAPFRNNYISFLFLLLISRTPAIRTSARKVSPIPPKTDMGLAAFSADSRCLRRMMKREAFIGVSVYGQSAQAAAAKKSVTSRQEISRRDFGTVSTMTGFWV